MMVSFRYLQRACVPAAFAVVGLGGLAVACGQGAAPGRSTLFDDGDSGAGGGPASGDGGSDGAEPIFTDAGVGPQGDAGDGCPESAKLVYVTGVGNQLWSFKPPSTFKLIGTMNCLASPTHMTVDRQGSAWVVSSGLLYKASTVDATCAQVPTWKPNGNFSDFSLTFVGNSNSPDPSLYILNDFAGLARFDTVAGSVSAIGNVSVAQTLGDMTSNGDGTLYYLNDVFNPVLYNFSPSSAATIKSYAIAANGGGAQALAFWGGSFYAFENSVIYQFDPKQSTTTKLGSAPLTVTGAGQSTCVPQVAPPPG